MWKVNKQQTCEIETQDDKHVKKNLKQKHIIRDKEQNKRARVFGQDHAYAWTSLRTQKGLCAQGNQPRNFNNTAKQSKAQNDKSNILTYLKT